jgi:hypothetical protein
MQLLETEDKEDKLSPEGRKSETGKDSDEEEIFPG